MTQIYKCGILKKNTVLTRRRIVKKNKSVWSKFNEKLLIYGGAFVQRELFS